MWKLQKYANEKVKKEMFYAAKAVGIKGQKEGEREL